LSQQSKDPIAAHLKLSLAALERATQDAALLTVARKIAQVIIAALRSGNKLLIVGNGGSAADAQHIAAEIVGRYKQDRPGWAAIALSTSGRSPNILAALRTARERGLVTVGFTGAKGETLATHCEHLLVAPSDDTPVVQQIHLAVAHGICDEIEQILMREGPRE
jgi:D-sedoheptulose 7-phosphate isomerase